MSRPRYPITIVCGPHTCPNDSAFEHDNYFGCVPRDFSPTTGKSKTYRQARVTDADSSLGYRYRWNGGCDANPGAGAGSDKETPVKVEIWRHKDGSVRVDHMDAREGDYYGFAPPAAEQRVVGLMEALEASVKAAKEARRVNSETEEPPAALSEEPPQ